MTTTAIRTDRARSAAHLGAHLLADRAPATITGPVANASRATFVGTPAYVADQESHPPRGGFPA